MAVLRQLFSEVGPEVQQRPLQEANFKATAHLLAFFRATHGATDLLAQLVYWGLGMDKKLPRALSERSISPARVYTQMEEHGLHPKVLSTWSGLRSLSAYEYLGPLVNTLKHRQLVKAGFIVSFDFLPDFKHGLEIGRFRYDSAYEPRWAGEIIRKDYPAIIKGVIGVGRTLNAELAGEKPAAA